MTMAANDLAREFEIRAPWITKFAIEGKEYGGTFDPSKDPRVPQFAECFPSASQVLELGSLEGGHTFMLARLANVERVVAVEGRKANIEKARFLQTLFGITNVQFVQANIERFKLSQLGSFDAIFCSGVLYHLPQPWRLIEQMSQISANLFIWTHYALEQEAKKVKRGYAGKLYREAGVSDPLSGLSAKSFWPTLDSLRTMLSRSGYGTIQILQNHVDHPHGPSVTLTATRS
jgi:protein-L-isoaspartate O-methyltransferase